MRAFRDLALGALALALAACSSPAPAAPGAAGGSAAGSGAASSAAPPTAAAATVPPSAPAAAATALPALPLRVAGSGLSGNLMGPWAAFEGGYLREQGLLVDGVPDIAASNTAVQTLLARDVDVINITPSASIEATLKGAADMPMIANLPPGAGWWMYGAPGLRTLDDLRGKTIGANQVGSTSYTIVDYALRRVGMQVGREYTILSLGNQPAIVASLQQGQIQGAPFSSPSNLLAQRSGFVELADLNDLPFNANGPIVRRDALDDPTGHEALRRYMKATVQAIARLRQDPAFGYAVLGQYLKISDPEIIEDVYRSYLPKRVPLVVAEYIPTVLESIAERDPAAIGADPRRFYDNSLVEELQASGFIDAQYR